MNPACDQCGVEVLDSRDVVTGGGVWDGRGARCRWRGGGGGEWGVLDQENWVELWGGHENSAGVLELVWVDLEYQYREHNVDLADKDEWGAGYLVKWVVAFVREFYRKGIHFVCSVFLCVDWDLIYPVAKWGSLI